MSVCETESEGGIGNAVKESPASRGVFTRHWSKTKHDAEFGEQTREAARSTMDRQKSAESTSCQRTAV